MIEIPKTVTKVTIHFREKGLLDRAYLGVETLKTESPEDTRRREEHAKKFRGENLYGIKRRHKGLVMGSTLAAFNGWTLNNATVQQRYTRVQEYVNHGGELCRKESHPYRWFTFKFIKSKFPKTQIFGEDTKLLLERMLHRGWTQLEVYNNPIALDGMKTDDTALVIDFISPIEHLPKHYEFGEEIVMGIRLVLNKTYQLKQRKTRPVLEQRTE